MSFEIAFVVLLLCVVAGRILSARALKSLSMEQKASLVDAFRGQSAYGLIPLIVLFAGYYALIRYTSLARSLISIAYWLALLVYLAWNFWFTSTRLATLRLPQTYLTQMGLARAVQYIGIGVLLMAVIGDEI